MVAAAAAPLLEPAFPTPACPPPAGPLLQGRDLYRRAVHDYLNGLDAQQRANEPLARRSPAQWDRAIDVKWNVLPSIVRRRWEGESHRLWPRNGDIPTQRISATEVFYSPDEVYYVRRRKRKPHGRRKAESQWDWDERVIINRYWQAFSIIPLWGAQGIPFGRAHWEVESDRINHARGFRPLQPNSHLLHIPFNAGVPNNGLMAQAPTVTSHFEDAQGLQAIMQNHQGHSWKWHKNLGIGGHGVAMLYRYTGPVDNSTVYRMVVKRDLAHGAGDMERSVFNSLRNSMNAGVPYSKYIIGFLGAHTPVQELHSDGVTWIPGMGRSYLTYAPFGSLHDLFNIYRHYNALLPEPFLWYLLLCLTEAARALERRVPGIKTQMFNYDLKPANILLDCPDTRIGAKHWHHAYPLLRTADLGGVETYPNPGQPENPAIRNMGTPGWQPFEVLLARDQRLCNSYRTDTRKLYYYDCPEAKAPLKVDEKMRVHTTIYQIGLILWMAMTLDYHRPPRQWVMVPIPANATPQQVAQITEHRYQTSRRDHPPRHATPRPPADPAYAGYLNTIPPPILPQRPPPPGRPSADPGQDAVGSRMLVDPRRGVRPHYSARLVECAYRCLDVDVAKRPSTRELLDEVADVCRGYEATYPGPDPGSQQAAPAAPAAVNALPRPRDVLLPRDKYPLGFLVRGDEYADAQHVLGG